MEIVPFSFNYNERFVTLAVEGVGFYKLGDNRLASTYARYILNSHLLLATDAYMAMDFEKAVGMLLYRDNKKRPLYENDASLMRCKEKIGDFCSDFAQKAILISAIKSTTL